MGNPKSQPTNVRVDEISEIIAAPINPLVTPIDVFSYTMNNMVNAQPNRIENPHINTMSLKNPRAIIARLPIITPITNPDNAIIAR